MTTLDIKQELESIADCYQIQSKSWINAVSNLSTTYFKIVGYSLDAALTFEDVVNIVVDEKVKAEKYLESEEKL